MTDADDSPQTRLARLVLALRSQGVTDPLVLSAIEKTPRDLFTPDLFHDRSWEDQALPIACGQTISQPFIVGLMTQALTLEPRARVLEIGTGSGYQAAILSRLCRDVLSIERYRTLADSARTRLERLELLNVEVMLGDGFDVPPNVGTFDRIIVTAAMEEVPDTLLDRLEPEGILIAPVGPQAGVQTLTRFTNTADGMQRKSLVDVRFVPALKGVAREM